MFGRVHQWGHLVLDFSLLQGFATDSIFFFAICMSRFSNSSCISYCSLYVSRNLYISNYLGYLICWHTIVLYYNPFYFCKVSSNRPAFILDFSYLHHLSLFFLVSLANSLSILLIFFPKEPTFGFVDSSYCFSILYFLYLCPNIYYFFPSVSFGFSLLFFFSVP